MFKYSSEGNLREVEVVIEMMKERGSSGKISILEESKVEAQVQVIQEEEPQVETKVPESV